MLCYVIAYDCALRTPIPAHFVGLARLTAFIAGSLTVTLFGRVARLCALALFTESLFWLPTDAQLGNGWLRWTL